MHGGSKTYRPPLPLPSNTPGSDSGYWYIPIGVELIGVETVAGANMGTVNSGK